MASCAFSQVLWTIHRVVVGVTAADRLVGSNNNGNGLPAPTLTHTWVGFESPVFSKYYMVGSLRHDSICH